MIAIVMSGKIAHSKGLWIQSKALQKFMKLIMTGLCTVFATDFSTIGLTAKT